MNICSEINSSNGFNYSDYLFHNGTVLESHFPLTSMVVIIIVLFALLTNSYVIWLIISGTGNGLVAEFFSLNLSVCEIFLGLEFLLSLTDLLDEKIISITVLFMYLLSMMGRPLFQCLICVERYLAVVHPVIFLKTKPLRYRLICSVIVWMLSFASGGVNLALLAFSGVYYIILFAQLIFILSVMLFCCVAVLRALKQSGPGERTGERQEKNQMKRKAFYVILITAVTLFTMYTPYLTVEALFRFQKYYGILASIASICFFLASLVQPLLFLHRERKLPFITYQ